MRTTLSQFQKMRQSGDRIAMLTCYDASFAALLDSCGVDTLLIGDSLGNVLQGHETTLPVTLRDMAYHTACVARGARHALIVSDMPFGSFQLGPSETFRNAAELMAAGAQMVKLEGGRPIADTIAYLAQRGIPVCAHLGLTPQSVHQLGGYKVQGRQQGEAERLLEDAKLVEAAGASMLVLEAIPSSLGKSVTDALAIPTIGIGAGPHCSGQVLVLHDMLDVFPGRKAKFVRNFMHGAGSIRDAVQAYVKEVKAGTFPGPEHEFR